MAGAAVEDRAEHAGGVRPRHAQPLHRTGRGDQAGVLAVGQERVVGDRRERVPQRSARGVGHRGRHGQRRRAIAAAVPRPRLLGWACRTIADIIDRRAARRPLVRRSVALLVAPVRSGDVARRSDARLAGWAASSVGGTASSCGCPVSASSLQTLIVMPVVLALAYGHRRGAGRGARQRHPGAAPGAPRRRAARDERRCRAHG